MKYDCGSSITFRVPGSITATNVAVVIFVFKSDGLLFMFRVSITHVISSSSSSVYLGSTSNHQTQKHNMNNENMRSKGQKGRDGTYNCP